MSSKILSAGDFIEARCTRCRTLMNHTIIAMVGDRVARVQCNTCGGMHNYREEKAAKTPAARTTGPKTPATPRAGRKDPGAADRDAWAAMRPNLHREKAKAYDMNGSYKVKDLVEHPLFGLGVVMRVEANKAEILFEGGKKLLRCQ